MNTLIPRDVKQAHDATGRWGKSPLIRAVGLGVSVALASGSAGAATVSVGPECIKVPATQGTEVCLSNDLTGLNKCIPLGGTSAMRICGTVTCNADGNISIVRGASDFEPPICNVLGRTITATTDLKCAATVTKNGLPIAMKTVGPVGPDDEIQICVRTR